MCFEKVHLQLVQEYGCQNIHLRLQVEMTKCEPIDVYWDFLFIFFAR